ncbi:hypothetical protein BKK79_33565 [Cupriavidus sp. USMAA2-4]|uniref:hypothetical protein n=1 Tax=Cupriavidus sp. USMAA2-4 TaxID=876364 RepID=UPI0008A6A611|nr:hypothetical protein [Cupriavidus sp. USMAA2-4]AOY96486.1 hypothetical protein BKK79_33565 [Cupriavidus sp. USMAA2-4]
MRTFKQALLGTVLATSLAAAAGLANAAPRAVDPYTDGATASSSHAYTGEARRVQGARDPYSDGNHQVNARRDAFSDGA